MKKCENCGGMASITGGHKTYEENESMVYYQCTKCLRSFKIKETHMGFSDQLLTPKQAEKSILQLAETMILSQSPQFAEKLMLLLLKTLKINPKILAGIIKATMKFT